MAKGNLDTSALLRKIARTADFYAFMKNNEGVMLDIPFCQYLSELCQQKHLVPEQIIKAAQIDRTYGHQLFNGTRKPSRDKVIQLAFGFGMTVEETQQLLHVAEKSPLYPRIKRDAAIIFCLAKGMGILETQNLLDSLGITLLGGDW